MHMWYLAKDEALQKQQLLTLTVDLTPSTRNQKSPVDLSAPPPSQ